MELNEEEKRQLFQVDGDCQAKVLDELYMTARFTRNPEQRDRISAKRSGISPPYIPA